MHPAAIQAELKMAGFSQADVAGAVGHKRPTVVWQVIHGRARSKRIEMAIAAATKRPLAELWPDWYGPLAKRRVRATPAERAAQIAQALEALQKKVG